MKNRIKLLGIIAIVALIGFSITACPNPADSSSGGSSTPDPWTDVTNYSQVNGTWLAPSSNTASLNGMTITQTFTDYKVTFNASAKTMAADGSSTTAYSGGSIASQWETLKAGLTIIYNEPPLSTAFSVTFDDTAHSYTVTGSGYPISMSDAELQSNGFKINQNGTELKAAAYGGAWEIIYTKVP